MDSGSFIVYQKTEDIYAEIPKVVEAGFVTLNHELDRPSSKGKKKKVIRLDEGWIRWEDNEIVCCIKSKNI